MKTIFTFTFPMTLTIGSQIYCPSYCCSALCFHQIRSLCGFLVSRKSGPWDGWMGCNT